MKWMLRGYGVLVFIAIACRGVPVVSVSPSGMVAPRPVASFAFHATVKERVPFVADSLIMTATYTLPVDDGRGAVDSLRLRWTGIFLDSSVVFRPPFPTSASVRQIIPPQAYSGAGGSATYNTRVEVQVWRRSTFTRVFSSEVPIVLNDAAPAPVTNLNFSAVKKP